MSRRQELSPGPADDVVEGLRRALDAEIAPLVAGRPAVALAIFPNHWNIGDSAIWVGQLATLERLGARAAYVCSAGTYDREALARALPEGPILLSGGGNLGDVYPDERGLRAAILSDFPDREVVQLPQSVWFRSEARAEEMRRACGRHRRFTLLVRDPAALAAARDRLGLDARLVPDMAFGLPDLRPRRDPPARDVLWLLRRDTETRDRALRTAAAHACPGGVRDWTRPGLDVAGPAWRTFVRAWLLSRRIARAGARALAPGREQTARTFAELAALRLALGLRLLSRGRVVVTDRLHAAILALLAGIPHVALDNSNGKVLAFCRHWLPGHPRALTATSLGEAADSARRLLGPPGT